MLNFAVGPVMMEEEILEIGSEQIPYFRTDDFSKIMLENEMLLKRAVKATDSSRVLFLTASGTAAMEATAMNVFTSKDKLLIVNGGSFGARFKEICDVLNLESEQILLEYGEPLSEEHLAPYEDKGLTGFLINVHETSTGMLYDMDLVGKFCKRNNLLLVVDAISSFLSDPYDMQKYGVNATILSSQKALALPPGMAFIVVDDVAQKRILDNNIHSLYFNLQNYLKDGKRGQTPYTPAVGILLQLRKRLESVDRIGVENIISQVSHIAEDFRKKISGLPLQIASPMMSNTLTPLKPVGKMTADEIFLYLKDNYGIFVCPNGGTLSKTLFRVGHIGAITETDNDRLVEAFFDMHRKGIL